MNISILVLVVQATLFFFPLCLFLSVPVLSFIPEGKRILPQQPPAVLYIGCAMICGGLPSVVLKFFTILGNGNGNGKGHPSHTFELWNKNTACTMVVEY
jgi:hypothetical protein